MYYAVVLLFMFVLPIASITGDWAVALAPFGAALVLKWYVFWAVGWRLFLAGTRQILQPEYTARQILGHKGDESIVLVRELGFANVSIGLVALISLASPSWRIPAAVAGGLFYLLAGANHMRQRHRNRLENVAMASDLIAGVVLFVALAGAMSA
ncbi:DUF6790 family protein [Variovorax sp. H27-G14]|uniref:DUF6790 family protein n=1 Tax=Variovorax sp. H27-G14 TaxID=3111914 RepID=UPI0038FC8F26